MREGVWWRLAWRNLWRNPKRTAISAGALALGFVSSTVMIGLSGGIVAQMIENGTDLLTGQVRVTQVDYRPERSLYTTLGGRGGAPVRLLLESIDGVPGVAGATPRVYAGGLVSSGSETVAGFLMGIDPEREATVSRLLAAMERGTLPVPGRRQALLGAEIADRLEVGLGAEIVLVAPAADGSLGNDTYDVVGIFRTGSGDLDGSYALLHLETLQDLVALPRERVHEITVRVAEPWDAPRAAADLDRVVREAGIEGSAEPWTAFRPDLAEYAQLAESFNWVIVLIVFVMAIFGVANTMLMATWERRREFAVVSALGSPARGTVSTVVYEALVLGVLSLAAGLAVVLPLVAWWSAAPPDLGWIVGDFTMAGATVEANLRIEPSVEGPLLSAIGLLATAVLAGLYPAFRTARQRPADVLAGAE